MTAVSDPVPGPEVETPTEEMADASGATPRLARHRITLSDGHEVGISVSGRGVPLVVVHGFTAEGLLYAQTLSRLVSMGFKVIAVDTAGHGATQGLPARGADLGSYAELLGRTLRELGVRQAILAGHSMGGRLVTQLAATDPDLAIAVILLDAIVGDTWDRMVYLFRVAPPVLSLVGVALAVDSMTTLPILQDPAQARKLSRLFIPALIGHLLRPWRMIGPSISILRSRSSRIHLDALAEAAVPVFAIHGDRDLAVPHRTARDAVRRADGNLITVHGASHSWLLKDPETLPSIVSDLLPAELGFAIRDALAEAGVDSSERVLDDIEQALYEPDAWIHELTPALKAHGPGDSILTELRQPRYLWSRERV